MNTKDIVGNERGIFIPSVRMSKQLTEQVRGEVDFLYATADFRDEIKASQAAGFGEKIFIGPAGTINDAELYSLSVLMRTEVDQVGRTVRHAYFAGAGAQFFDLEVSSGGIRSRSSTFSLGPQMGYDLIIDPASWLDFYGRASMTIGFPYDSISFGAVETGITVKPAPNLSLFGGWRLIEYRQDDEISGAGITMRLSGPMVGVHLEY